MRPMWRTAGALAPIDWGPLDSFVAQNVQTMKDTGNLYGTIAFMQRLDGEKHLVFVTERGLGLQHADDWRDLGRAAADSRVAIDVLQTGGLIGDDMTFHLRGLSEMTGGMASISEYSRLGLERLDGATRTSYLLGYYPTNGKWDGAFRTIEVKVNRPGVTLSYRRGYNARVAAAGVRSRRIHHALPHRKCRGVARRRQGHRRHAQRVARDGEQPDLRRRERPDRPRRPSLRRPRRDHHRADHHRRRPDGREPRHHRRQVQAASGEPAGTTARRSPW